MRATLACTRIIAIRKMWNFHGIASVYHRPMPESSNRMVLYTMPQKKIFWPQLKRPTGGSLSSSLLMYDLISCFHARSSASISMSRGHWKDIQKYEAAKKRPTQGCQKRAVGPPPTTAASQ